MNIIRHYLARTATTNIVLVIVALLGMFSFLDLLQEMDNVGQASYKISTMLVFVLLSVPGHVYEVVPVSVLIGMMYTLAQFSRHSELLVLRTAGVSIVAIGRVFLKTGLVFALFTFLVGELVTPVSEKTAQKLRLKASHSVIAQDFRSGLWIKDGNNFVNIEEVLPDAQLLRAHIYEFDQQFQLQRITDAASGSFDEQGKWELQDVTQTDISQRNIQQTHRKSAYWDSSIQPELLNVLLVLPEKMSAWNLYFYIRHLSENNQNTTRYQIALWAKIVYPCAALVMIILALPFGFLQQRSHTSSAYILGGIMLGISFLILNRLSSHIGLLDDWPPLISAITPTLLFLSIGLGMLLWTERR